MKGVVVYIHGKGGSAEEAERYQKLFPQDSVIGFPYTSKTPWQVQEEFPLFFEGLQKEFKSVRVIANSIGAFFTLHGLKKAKIERAFLISPIVDMEKLISNMMLWASVSEQDLQEKGSIETTFGETLSMEYLVWVRNHPTFWQIPTSILYGNNDHLQGFHVVKSFAEKIGGDITVMENGEHWFHTEEQMAFLNAWILSHLDSIRKYKFPSKGRLPFDGNFLFPTSGKDQSVEGENNGIDLQSAHKHGNGKQKLCPTGIPKIVACRANNA